MCVCIHVCLHVCDLSFPQLLRRRRSRKPPRSVVWGPKRRMVPLECAFLERETEGTPDQEHVCSMHETPAKGGFGYLLGERQPVYTSHSASGINSKPVHCQRTFQHSSFAENDPHNELLLSAMLRASSVEGIQFR